MHYEATLIWYNDDVPKYGLDNLDSDAYVIIDCNSTLPNFSYDVLYLHIGYNFYKPIFKFILKCEVYEDFIINVNIFKNIYKL